PLSEPGAGVEDQHDRVRGGDRLASLPLDLAGERVLGGEVDAAGVHEVEADPVPLALDRLAVAGHPGLVVDDGLAAAGEPVDERRLADVRKADDRDLRSAGVHGERSSRRSPLAARPLPATSPRSAAIAAIRATTSSTPT